MSLLFHLGIAEGIQYGLGRVMLRLCVGQDFVGGDLAREYRCCKLQSGYMLEPGPVQIDSEILVCRGILRV